jgi:quinol monooxygenase YgiN
METQARHQTYDYVQAAMPAIDACLAGPPRCEWLDVVL